MFSGPHEYLLVRVELGGDVSHLSSRVLSSVLSSLLPTGASSLVGSTAHHNGVAIRESLLQDVRNAGQTIEKNLKFGWHVSHNPYLDAIT